MRKRLITPIRQASPMAEPAWLHLDRVASVEVTSEDKEHPIEGALVHGDSRGWRASERGTQVIRLVFDEPVMKAAPCVFTKTAVISIDRIIQLLCVLEEP